MAALATLLAAAWWVQRPPGGPFPSRHTPSRVLLITIDTLRADALGAYGRGRARTYWMDRLAARGIRFDRARAHAVVTLPSHASILSGRYPFEHGVRDNGGFRVPSSLPTLATILKDRGFRTGAFVSAFPLDSRFGLDRGFDVYDDEFVGAATPKPFLVQERAGAQTVARARRWLDAQGDAPALCWVHLYEPHFPYAPPAAIAAQAGGHPYDGEVAAADAALGPLLAPILGPADRGRTLVVLTSDHGESLGEHGEATHGIFAYEATLRVPLVVYVPGAKPATIGAAVEHVDILPTILGVLGVPAPSGLSGVSLAPALAGAAVPSRATYFEAMSGALNRGWAPLRGIVRDEWKLVDLPEPELYDLGSDPREAHNLAAAQPTRVAGLRAQLSRLPLDGLLSAARSETSDTRERLRSLGYVGGAAAPRRTHYTASDDPKRLIALDALLEEVVGRYLDGDLRGALSRCRELVRRRPEMPISWLYLAHLERDAGRIETAVDALDKAAALNPADAETLALLGAYLTEAGHADRAVARLEDAAHAKDPDVNVLVSYALAMARTGRAEGALAALGRARTIDPSNAMLRVQAGTVHLMAGDRTRARAEFEAAVRLSPDAARAHSSLGILDAEDGRLSEAAGHWRHAVAADPREHRTILGVGLNLARQGRHADARPYLEFFAASAPPAQYASELSVVERLLGTVR